MRRPAVYNTDTPGKTIREERIRQGMTQQELALAIGVTPAMVARMERTNHGLDSVQTRRDIAKALGISPLLLGVGTKAHTNTYKLYSTEILRTTLALHREAFYTTGNFGIPAVNKMVGELTGILKQEGSQREILEVYTEYATLGIMIAREELNTPATEKYIKRSLDGARSLNNPILLARALNAASHSMYELGKFSQAETYSLEAMSLVNKLPNHLQALLQADLGLTTNDTKAVEKSLILVRRENDFPELNLDPGYCCMSGAEVFLNTRNLRAADVYLTEAEQQIPARFVRRHSILQILQAEYYLAKNERDNAGHVAETALILAQQTKSHPKMKRLRGIINRINL